MKPIKLSFLLQFQNIRYFKTALHFLTALPSRFMYGNDAGMRLNICNSVTQIFRQCYSIIPFCKSANSPHSALISYCDLPEHLLCSSVNQLKESGFCSLENIYHPCTLSEIEILVQETFDRDRGLEWSANGLTSALVNPAKYELIRKLYARVFHSILSEYYNSSYIIKRVRCWRNHSFVRNPSLSVSQDVYSDSFHNDRCSIEGLRIFVLLTNNVTRLTGAMRYIDKSATSAMLRRLVFKHRRLENASFIDQIQKNQSLRYFEGGIGDVLIFNTQKCLHAASIPMQGFSRTILQFEIEPAYFRPRKPFSHNELFEHHVNS